VRAVHKHLLPYAENFSTLTSAIPQVRAGRVKILAVTSPERSSAVPDVPTVQESGVRRFAVTQWAGVFRRVDGGRRKAGGNGEEIASLAIVMATLGSAPVGARSPQRPAALRPPRRSDASHFRVPRNGPPSRAPTRAFSFAIRFSSSEAGSSFGSCGTNLARTAR
jgi:hypothetical protein